VERLIGDNLSETLGRDEVSTMQEFRPINDSPRPAARCSGVHDRTLLGLLFFTLVRSGEALAGDQTSIVNAAANPAAADSHQSSPAPAAMFTNPEFFSVPKTAEVRVFSATDFRPRKPTVFDRDPAIVAFGDAPMLHGTTVWQRLAEYRSHDRVRVLTLWESSGSTVSLQAGKRGDPSLQWSSRVMNRNGSTRGLLDHLFSLSFAGGGNSPRNTLRATIPPAAPKPAANSVVAGLK
jgi:hypothetical protein